jgi:hypothetical protein
MIGERLLKTGRELFGGEHIACALRLFIGETLLGPSGNSIDGDVPHTDGIANDCGGATTHAGCGELIAEALDAPVANIPRLNPVFGIRISLVT